jgi:putative DNA primase/helicase
VKTINDFLNEPRLHDFEVRLRDLQVITDAVIGALITANEDDSVLFRCRGVPAWFEFDDHGKPSLREIGPDRMRHLLARRFSWERFGRNGEVIPTSPPIDVVRDILASPNIPLPIVDRIVHVPVFGGDGKIHTEPGYNPATRCIYLPCHGMDAIPPVSAKPNGGEIAAALALLDELVCDFPFVDPGKTHTLGAMLVPFARAFISGSTPLHLFEKPRPGTGATLLAQVICDICVGAPVAAMTESRSDDEFSRKIHSKLRSGPAVIFLDNLRIRLDSAALAAALTNDVIEDRIVQRSETESAAANCLWLGTANNPSLSDEMARRTIPIRLDSKMARPYLRQDFLHKDLRPWVRENHACLVWALLTLIQAWIVAGRPKGQKRLGMFESYSEIIGGILEIAGVRGFLDLEEQVRLEDDEDGLGRLIPAWYKKYQSRPVGVADLYPICTQSDPGRKTEEEQRAWLGRLLRANRDRRFGEFVIVNAGKRHGSNLWQLEVTPDGQETL